MGIVRLPSHGSDVLVTLSTPVWISPASASAQHAGAGAKGAHLGAAQLLRRILATLAVTDWSLFGGEAEA